MDMRTIRKTAAMKLRYILLFLVAISLVMAAMTKGLTYPMQVIFFALVGVFFVVLGKAIAKGEGKTGTVGNRAGS